MQLNSLKSLDSKTANGVLAAAALSTAPDPGVGERPNVLRAYEREAAAVLSEIRHHLRIAKDNDSSEARRLVSKALTDALQKSILADSNTADILSRIGSAGRLPPYAYNVVQSKQFQEFFYALGISRNNIEEAVKSPDDFQHMMTEGMHPDARDLSLFMKRVMSREPTRRNWLLVQSHRIGTDQKVGAAWRVYPDDVDIQRAQTPVDVLKAFVFAFGVPVKIGDARGLFLDPQTFPAESEVAIDWSGAPPEHFLATSRTTSGADGLVRIGATYCIDIAKYRSSLKRHGVKVEMPSTPYQRVSDFAYTEHV